MTEKIQARLKVEMKTQAQMVFDYLNLHGKLTRITAVFELGVMELSSRIGEIEAGVLDSGPWLIPRTSVPFTARNGRKSRFTEYHTPIRPQVQETRSCL